MKKYTLDDLRFYEKIMGGDSVVPYAERLEKILERFGEDVSMTDILDGLDNKYTFIEAGTFDSPGYDMWSYVVAWLEDGKIKQECFIEESF